MAQYAHLSIPDPEWAELSAHLPPTQPVISIQAYREQVMAVYGSIIKPESNNIDSNALNILETKIPVENGEIRVKAYIPIKRDDETLGFPLMIWMFGGGFVLGTIEQDEPLLSDLAVKSRITCVCGDYRKAPEHPFPAAVDDSYAVLKWALGNKSELSVDTCKGVIVGGTSAGGNIAAVLAHRAIRDPQLKDMVTGQLLVIPGLISPYAYPEKFKSQLLSAYEGADKHCLPKDLLFAFAKAYTGEDNVADPDASPLLAKSFEGLPPAYIQICGLDPLRDEAFLYEKLLKEAGVSTRTDVYPGLPHGFHILFPKLMAAKKQKADFIGGLDWLLKRSK